MTEKRFTLTFDDKIVDNLTGIIHEVHSGYDVAMDLSGLLNTLNDENEQLKSDYDTLKIQDDARKQYQKELMKENEELKKEVKQLKNKINTYHEGNKTLHQTLQKYWEDRYNE